METLTRDLSMLFSRLLENYELLKSRLMNIDESKSQLEVDIKRKTQHNRVLISDMNSLKPEIKRLTRQRDQLKKWVQVWLFSFRHKDDNFTKDG